MRAAAIILLAVSATALGYDVYATWTSGFRFLPIGELWFDLHRDSRLLIQPALERHVHEDLYFAVVEPVLRQQTAPATALVGAGLLGLSVLRRRLAR